MFMNMMLSSARFIEWHNKASLIAAFGILVVVQLSVETARSDLILKH